MIAQRDLRMTINFVDKTFDVLFRKKMTNLL